MAADQTKDTFTSISFLKKRPDISHEQFYHHWQHVHGPLVKPWMEKHGFLSYTQVHATPALNAGAAPLGPEVQQAGGSPLAAYDGAAVIEVPSFEVFSAAFQDEYYRTVIAEDEARFLDRGAGVLRTRGEAKKIVKMI